MIYEKYHLYRFDFHRIFESAVSRKISWYLFAKTEEEAAIKFDQFAEEKGYNYTEANLIEINEDDLDECGIFCPLFF